MSHATYAVCEDTRLTKGQARPLPSSCSSNFRPQQAPTQRLFSFATHRCRRLTCLRR